MKEEMGREDELAEPHDENRPPPRRDNPEWTFPLCSNVLLEVLEYLDVASLVEKKQVSSQWQELCVQAIDRKCGGAPKLFRTNKELRGAIQKYINSSNNTQEAEEIASTYSWPIGKWDVSKLEDFLSAFASAHEFNEDISGWNISRATNTAAMFCSATSFNQSLADWVTSNVQCMDSMFEGAINFNQPLADWNTSNVQYMSYMFHGAINFNQPLADWNTSNVQTMTGMFCQAASFNQPLADWNTSNLQTMRGMFQHATSFNQPLEDWDTSCVRSLQEMFHGATSFNQQSVAPRWNTARVFNMIGVFCAARSCNHSLAD